MDYVKENINKIGTKNYIIFVRCLEALDDYYKNINFYKWIFSNNISQELLDLIDNEMTNLFKILNTKIITPDDIEKYWELPLLGVVPEFDDGPHSKKKKRK